jgi:hypothetical protein
MLHRTNPFWAKDWIWHFSRRSQCSSAGVPHRRWLVSFNLLTNLSQLQLEPEKPSISRKAEHLVAAQDRKSFGWNAEKRSGRPVLPMVTWSTDGLFYARGSVHQVAVRVITAARQKVLPD